MRYTITNTVRDITKLSYDLYEVEHSTAIVHSLEDARWHIIEISRYLKLDPAEFLVTDENGKRLRLMGDNR